MSTPGQLSRFLGWGGALLVVPLSTIFVAKTLAMFAAIVQGYLAIHYGIAFELGMVGGQVLFQWLVLVRAPWSDRLEYALVLLLVSTLGATLLWPLLLLNHMVPVTASTAVLYFFAVVLVMFAGHWRLVVRAGLPTRLCATWVVYRLLILAVILKR